LCGASIHSFVSCTALIFKALHFLCFIICILPKDRLFVQSSLKFIIGLLGLFTGALLAVYFQGVFQTTSATLKMPQTGSLLVFALTSFYLFTVVPPPIMSSATNHWQSIPVNRVALPKHEARSVAFMVQRYSTYWPEKHQIMHHL
jgi:hypothetical protein